MNRIVSTCQYRDFVFIFCENGDIYRMVVDEYSRKVSFYLEVKFRPEP